LCSNFGGHLPLVTNDALRLEHGPTSKIRTLPIAVRQYCYKYFIGSWWLKRLSTFIKKHPVIFCVTLTFFLIMLSGAIEDYSHACKKEWGSKWENNTRITVYEFNGMFCAFVRWID
jgi:hypothetical protein